MHGIVFQKDETSQNTMNRSQNFYIKEPTGLVLSFPSTFAPNDIYAKLDLLLIHHNSAISDHFRPAKAVELPSRKY